MENEQNRKERAVSLIRSIPLSCIGVVTLAFHAVVMMLSYFIDLGWLMTADYVILGLTAAAGIYYAAKKQIPVRFQPAQTLLVLFMGWFILSCISMTVTYNNDWVNHNSFPMLNTAICLFLAFPLGYVLIREKSIRFADILFQILLFCWTVFIAYVLFRIFRKETISTPNGGTIKLQTGLRLNCHYNITGAYEMLAFLISCFLALRCRPFPLKITYSLFAVIHYIALALSNSRTSVLSTLAGFAALIGIAVYLRLEKKQKPHRLIWSVIAALLAGAAFYLLSGLVFKLYNAATASKAAARSTMKAVAANTTFTGRTDVWKAAIEGIFSSVRAALFGVTPMSAADMINQVIQSSKTTYSHAHNEFLQIAASNGIPALLIFLGWFFLMLKDMYRLFITQKNRTLFLFVPVLILALMLANQMESFLLYGYEIMGFTFFLFCGILHGKVNDPIPAGHFSRLPVISKLKDRMRHHDVLNDSGMHVITRKQA